MLLVTVMEQYPSPAAGCAPGLGAVARSCPNAPVGEPGFLLLPAGAEAEAGPEAQLALHPACGTPEPQTALRVLPLSFQPRPQKSAASTYPTLKMGVIKMTLGHGNKRNSVRSINQ